VSVESVAAPPVAEVAACVLPGYPVLAHLRRGSLLDVYDVWSAERQSRCIAKVLRPDRAGEPGARRRLLREGRLLLRLSHPHIVRAYELHQGATPGLILETLTGQTLQHLIEQLPRGLGAADLAVLGLQLVSAVHYLHAQGVLHLDLKPSNIVSESGITKVLDLDIARPPGLSRGSGTRQYMAPEQVRGGTLTFATDVWGIGVVLFEAATRRLPFDFRAGRTYPQRERRAEPIQSYRRRLPPVLRQAIMGALEPEPSSRPSLDELGALLSGVLMAAGFSTPALSTY
jgi:eukaryotic-like serine/threonine-protein kinase